MNTPKFSTRNNAFYGELRRRINQYFQDANIAPTGNFQLYSKAAILILSFIGVYIHLVFFTPGIALALVECIIMAGLTAAIGFNVMHDGAHGSFSRHNWANKMAGLTLNFLGANVFMWTTKHNVIHHTFTNISGVDDDIDAGIFLRLCEEQKRLAIHRYQHMYFWIAYSFLYAYWVFFSDYRKYFTGKVGDIPLAPMKLKDHISFWGFKIIHAFLFLGLPIYFIGFGPWLVGYALYSLFAGFVLSIVFQLAHTVEDTQFPVALQPANEIEDEWAVHQLKTTANFATKNKVVSWLVGGLNFQIEHHLFPKISHVHYPAISTIIKQVCAEYGIPYIEYPRTRLAVASHINHLRHLGQN